MSQTVRPRVLFLCTGNYYRSRFAERLFSVWAERHGLDWEADSRGLFEVQNPGNVGFMSPYAVAQLRSLSIDPGPRDRYPLRLTREDLRSATRIVALDATEHRPMLASRFPDWVERVDFWQVPDVDRMPPREALFRIEKRVLALVDALVHVSTGEAARLAWP